MADIDASANSLDRLRRQFQALHEDGFYTIGNGLAWDSDTNTLSILLNTNVMYLTSAGLGMYFFTSPDSSSLVLDVTDTFTVNTIGTTWTDGGSWGLSAGNKYTIDSVGNMAFNTQSDLSISSTGAISLTPGNGLNITTGSTMSAEALTSMAFNTDGDYTAGAGGAIGITALGGNADFGTTYTGGGGARAQIFGPGGVSLSVAAFGGLLSGVVLNSSSAYIMGVSAAVVSEVKGYSSATVGDARTIGGSPTLGTNVNAGLGEVTGGVPRGTGTSTAKLRVRNNAGAAQERIAADLTGLGFYGATPIAQPGTYTITAAPAVATALNADGNAGVAYTAIADTGATNLAAAADLNDLRTDVISLAAVLRQLIKHLGDTAGLGLVNETSY